MAEEAEEEVAVRDGEWARRRLGAGGRGVVGGGVGSVVRF